MTTDLSTTAKNLVQIFETLPKTYQQALLELAISMQKQAAKGLAKYGTTIDESSDQNYDWHEMAHEEITDMIVYLQKSKNQANKIQL